jgi:hypothetical protein
LPAAAARWYHLLITAEGGVMIRTLGVVVVACVAAAAVAAPVPKSLRSKVADVTGTVWVSDETAVNLGVIEYTFLEGGKLSWHQVGKNDVSTNGSWRQEGDHLYWEVNQKYVDYNVDFRGGRFEGGAVNKTNTRWTITLRPKEK